MKLRLALALIALATPAFAQLPTPNNGCNMQINGVTVGCPASIAVGGTGGATASAARTSLGITATGADTTYAFRANNLSDLASASTARTNLGVTATGADTTYAYRANNLSDLANAATARINLGLGSLAILSTINNSNWSGTALALGNGGTGQTSAAAARALSGLNVESATGHGDSTYAILATDRWVYTNAPFTASRTWTLPAANSVNPGAPLVIDDAQSTITPTNTLVVSRASSDTVNGGTSFTIDVARGRLLLYSDGVSQWTARLQRPYGTAAGNAISLDSNAKLPAVDGSALTALDASKVTTNKGQLPGTATNDSASSGNVGEIIKSNIASGSAISLANSTAANLTNISLTAGDWDVECLAYFLPTATTSVIQLQASISTTSATMDFANGNFSQTVLSGSGTVLGANVVTVRAGTSQRQLSSTTTVYCPVLAAFTASTMTAYGLLRARRMR